MKAARPCGNTAAALPACRSVLMVGTDLAGMGGVRAVVQGYVDGGLFDRIDCVYVATHRYGSHWSKLTAALKGWIAAAVRLRTMEAPLVHAHISPGASFWRKSVVCALARLAGRPYLLHVHGGEWEKFCRECPAPTRGFVRSTFSKAALVIALSQQWRATLERVFPEARIEVMSNAVPLPSLDERRSPGARPPTLLFLGDVARHKGVFDLARAFARVAGRFPGSRLVLCGAGEIEAMGRLAAELELAGRIDCPGWLPSERKRAALAGATAFVLPSYMEGMPMALLEAMACGLPVIATAVGGVPEVITHEVNGLLVPPGDIDALAAALARLMSDSRLRRQLGTAARETIAARFSLNAAVERLVGLYRRFGIEPRVGRARGQVFLDAAADGK